MSHIRRIVLICFMWYFVVIWRKIVWLWHTACMEGAREEKYRIFSKNLWGCVVIWNIYSKEGKIMLNDSEGTECGHMNWTEVSDKNFWWWAFLLLELNPGVQSTWGSSGYLIQETRRSPHMLQKHRHYNRMA